MRVIVTGDRRWAQRDWLFAVLDHIHHDTPITLLIEGCARGADTMAGDHPGGWARERGVPGAHYPADWRRYRLGAGPKRNEQMLLEGVPELVVAFHSNIATSRGTADMVRQAHAAGVRVVIRSR